ncbi:putative DNA-directed RNA polymerase [Arabidopsis thaliana]
MILWLENPLVFAPQKESFKSTSRKEPLLPFEVKFFCFEHVSECRQAKISYTGTFMADVCFKYNDGVVVRDKFDFGQFPIMLMSKLCSLKGADCRKLLKCKESTSEMGGMTAMFIAMETGV